MMHSSLHMLQDLVKKPTDSGLKKNSAAVKKFLEELAKIGNTD